MAWKCSPVYCKLLRTRPTFLSSRQNVITDIRDDSFQQAQGLSALGASIRILPSLITAVLTNVSTGYFVNRMPVMWMVLFSCGLSALSPLLMAIINPRWPYWYMAFFAQVSAKLGSHLVGNMADPRTKSFFKVSV